MRVLMDWIGPAGALVVALAVSLFAWRTLRRWWFRRAIRRELRGIRLGQDVARADRARVLRRLQRGRF